jgi:EAL domain-containing protein (putative c-di-GMP-specific phosphodiesterase class I)
MRALAASGLPARRLELEITESTMFKDSASVLAAMHALQERGVRIAVDDFGTGFSSLSHLRSFPFDHLKIDRSFVRDAPERPDLCAIIHGVAVLAQGMQMETTVEGVEAEEQLRAVRPLGCTSVQGYLLGRPDSAADVGALIAVPPAPPA